jgi:hypothetical protein
MIARRVSRLVLDIFEWEIDDLIFGLDIGYFQGYLADAAAKYGAMGYPVWVTEVSEQSVFGYSNDISRDFAICTVWRFWNCSTATGIPPDDDTLVGRATKHRS